MTRSEAVEKFADPLCAALWRAWHSRADGTLAMKMCEEDGRKIVATIEAIWDACQPPAPPLPVKTVTQAATNGVLSKPPVPGVRK